jgi:hypothetical protein
LGVSLTSLAQVIAPSKEISKGKDSLAMHHDSLVVDSAKVKKMKQDEDFKSKIVYSAKDSITYSADYQKAYLYGDAKVTYEDIELTSAYMEYNFATNIVYAAGVKDSLGNDVGLPDFKKGSETFKSQKLTYNFKTKKGIIYNIVAEQEGGILHAEKTKREADGSINIRHGIYTTCDLPHPHFGIVITKGKVLPNDKIISGPAYMEFEDVPLPLFLPFGFFPNSRKNSISGIIMPTYGEETTRGFYLRNGGYYFALSQYYDLLLTGDIYSKGDWGMEAKSSYAKRYKYSGNFDISRYVNKSGLLGVDSGLNKFGKSYDFKIMWTHTQAQQANPSQRFNASVNYSSLTYNQNQDYYGTEGVQNLMTTNKSSSISYSKSWTNSNLSVNLGGNQNSNPQSRNVTFNLPTAAYNVNRFYPFRRKNPTGNLRWYENLTLSYTASLQNTFSGPDSTIFTKKTLRTAQNGFKQSIPFSTNIKFLKYFNLSPSLSYSGMIYTSQISKSQRDSFNRATNLIDYYEHIDTIHKISYAQDFKPAVSLSFNPTIYGMFQFGPKSKLNAIRHVITPSVGFSFVPGIKGLTPNYFKNYTDQKTNNLIKYGIYDQNIYGTPQGSTRSGTLSFSLGNNLEMKVKSAKDTVTGLKKIVLIQSLNFSTNYNIYAPSNKLSYIAWGGNSPIIKGLNVNYSGSIDPYEMSAAGNDSSAYYWKGHKGIGRLTSAGLSFGYTFQAGGPQQKTTETKVTDTNKQPDAAPKKEDQKPKGDFAYFKIPWSFTFAYTLNYSKPQRVKTIVQSLQFSGNLNLTPKWSINYTSGYDFKNKGFSPTSFSITRNLHCFMMSINFSPFGTYKYYEFRISAISQFLHDLKYDQHKDYRDYPTGF